MRNMQITGNIGGEPQIRTLNSGTKVANFNLAVRQNTPTNGEYGTDWVRCAVFGKRADVIEKYFKKGDHVAVAGEWSINEWSDKNGEKQFTLQLSVNDFDLPINNHGGQNNNQSNSSQSKDPFANNGDSIDISDEDLPF